MVGFNKISAREMGNCKTSLLMQNVCNQMEIKSQSFSKIVLRYLVAIYCLIVPHMVISAYCSKIPSSSIASNIICVEDTGGHID